MLRVVDFYFGMTEERVYYVGKESGTDDSAN